MLIISKYIYILKYYRLKLSKIVTESFLVGIMKLLLKIT